MHGDPAIMRSTLLSTLASYPVVHGAIRALRIQQLAARALSAVPVRRTRRSGLTYRVKHLESFLVADEIFRRHIYGPAFEGTDVRTFVDIGSNVGYFPLFVAEVTGRRDVTGLLVDANEAMVEESRWHLAKNGLSSVQARRGVAGHPPDVKECTFYVNTSNIASSAQPDLNPAVPAKGESVAVTVPTVDVAAEWKALAPGKRIDLLKIDVEGFECDLVRNSSELLGLADRIVIEWHKWTTSLSEIDSLLGAHGFVRGKIITDEEHAGVAVFDRRRDG